MAENLVKVDRKELLVDSRVVAKGVDVEHRSLFRTILKYEEDLKELGLLRIQIAKVKMGRPIKYALLNEEQALLICTYCQNSPIVRKFKQKLVKEFVKQRKILSSLAVQKQNQEYLAKRKQGIMIRKEETDVIKEFIDYCIAQGSTHYEQRPQDCYANISKMENKALFILEQKYKNLREILDFRQISIIENADTIVSRALKEGMEQKMNYKDIYKMAKERVENFSELIGRSIVPSVKYMGD